MPTASQRPASTSPKSTDKGGASTASNETPVSTREQPNPPSDPNTRASRPQTAAPDVPHVKAPPKPADKANGRDHPTESEHDHTHQKLNGPSSKRH